MDFYFKKNPKQKYKTLMVHMCMSLETNYKHFVRITQRAKARDALDN